MIRLADNPGQTTRLERVFLEGASFSIMGENLIPLVFCERIGLFSRWSLGQLMFSNPDQRLRHLADMARRLPGANAVPGRLHLTVSVFRRYDRKSSNVS